MPNGCGFTFPRVSFTKGLFKTALVSLSLCSGPLLAQEATAAPTEPPPAEATAAEGTPAEATAAEGTPAEATAAEGTPAEATAAEGTPAEATAAEGTPAEEAPAEATPSEAPPAMVSEAPHPADEHAHTHLDGAGDVEPKEAVAVGNCKKGVPCLEGGGFAIWPRARLIAGYTFVQPDPQVLFVGQNDGFFIDHMRVGFEGNWGGRLDFKMVADGASFLPDGLKNDAIRPVFGNFRDAYVRWRPSEYFNVWGGQFHVPNNIESSASRTTLPFSTRSVAADGVRPGQGYETRGLGIPRQLGVMLGSEKAPIGPVNLDYRVALTNGNGININGNDNKLPAVFSRVAVGYGDLVNVGFGLNYNPTTAGELPSLYLETEMGGFFDVAVRVLGFELIAQVMARSTSFDTALPEADPNRINTALGATAWLSIDRPLGLDIFGLNPALRVSYLDPNSSFDDDQVLETSLGLRYEPSTQMPVAFVFDVTLLFELTPTGNRELDNHRATAMMVFEL